MPESLPVLKQACLVQIQFVSLTCSQETTVSNTLGGEPLGEDRVNPWASNGNSQPAQCS